MADMNQPDFYDDCRVDISDGAHFRVEVVADTKSSEHGVRITTLACTYPRYIHAQMLTHRMFSRNAQSSRAVPTRVLMDKVQQFPVMPQKWGSNQPGMVAGAELGHDDMLGCQVEWLRARDAALIAAKRMSDLGLHKESVNRLLEPFSTITAIYTATEWRNFFDLRLEEDAQPEIQKLAQMIAEAMDKSDAVKSRHHLPYVMREEYQVDALREMFKLSAARCARVSYLTHDGQRDIVKDLDLADRLASSGHWSPWEHPALSNPTRTKSANYRGWSSARNLRGE